MATAVLVALAAMAVSQVRGDDQTALQAAAERAIAEDGSGVEPGGVPQAAAERAAVARYLALGLPIFCGGGRGRYVALTFDDGPGRHTRRLVRMLRAPGAQATFFLIGRQAAQSPDLVRQQLTVGAVGDHTWNHAMLTRISGRRMTFELAATKQVLELAGGRPIDLFRPPYEVRNRAIDRRAVRLGMLPILWNVDTADSNGREPRSVVREAVRGLRPGAIILMHETKAESVAAVPKILAAARRRRLRLVSIPRLLALDPPPAAQVRAGHGGCTRPERFRGDRPAG